MNMFDHNSDCRLCGLSENVHYKSGEYKLSEALFFKNIRKIRTGKAIPRGWRVIKKSNDGVIAASPLVVELSDPEEARRCCWSTEPVKIADRYFAITAKTIAEHRSATILAQAIAILEDDC